MEVKDAHTAREWVYTIKDLMEGQYKEDIKKLKEGILKQLLSLSQDLNHQLC